jgi:hypothetical protein
MPTSVCNIIGNLDTSDYSNIVLGGFRDNGNDTAITAQDGRRLGYFVSRQR